MRADWLTLPVVGVRDGLFGPLYPEVELLHKALTLHGRAGFLQRRAALEAALVRVVVTGTQCGEGGRGAGRCWAVVPLAAVNQNSPTQWQSTGSTMTRGLYMHVCVTPPQEDAQRAAEEEVGEGELEVEDESLEGRLARSGKEAREYQHAVRQGWWLPVKIGQKKRRREEEEARCVRSRGGRPDGRDVPAMRLI